MLKGENEILLVWKQKIIFFDLNFLNSSLFSQNYEILQIPNVHTFEILLYIQFEKPTISAIHKSSTI